MIHHWAHLRAYHDVGGGYPPLQRVRALLRQLSQAGESAPETERRGGQGVHGVNLRAAPPNARFRAMIIWTNV